MLNIDTTYVADRLPRELTDAETKRLQVLIDDAVELIDVAFMQAGRDFDAELVTVPWLESAARRAELSGKTPAPLESARNDAPPATHRHHQAPQCQTERRWLSAPPACRTGQAPQIPGQCR